LRVTVVGEQVFAAEIDSQSNTKARDDIHRGPLPALPKSVFNLDNTTSKRCIRIIKSLGLKYGAIDFVIEKNGNITFLEVNPTGEWYWIEHETNLPITEAMVDFIQEVTSLPRR
jgi:glutathione synthase/RimK-type ligase-like ATP-grasp enzyme